MDEGHRWARITPNDHSGAVYIVTFVWFTYSSLTFLTRLLIKWRVLGLDDLAMLAAQVASIVQFALLLASPSAGLATSFETLDEHQYMKMSSTYSGVQVAIYVSLGFSKLATILLVRRLFIRDMKSAWTICNIITAVVAGWTVVSASLVSAGCSADGLLPETSSNICPNIETHYLFVVIADGTLDLVLTFVPTYLCRRLQMDILFKLQVLCVFALGLPVLLLAGLFYRDWTASMHSNNPEVDPTSSLVYQQCQLCCSLVAATVPCLKSFIQSFDTGSGQKAGFGYSSNSNAYGHMSSVHHRPVNMGHSENYEMDRLEYETRFGHAGSNEQAVRVNSRAFTDVGSTLGEVLELERRSTQDSDRKSQQSIQELVIRKDVKFHVKREPAKGIEPHRPGLLRLPK